jgi:hypothetical protein
MLSLIMTCHAIAMELDNDCSILNRRECHRNTEANSERDGHNRMEVYGACERHKILLICREHHAG